METKIRTGVPMWFAEPLQVEISVKEKFKEPKHHHDNCYFCTVDNTEFSHFKNCQYPNLQSAKRFSLHSENIPVPINIFLPKPASPDVKDYWNFSGSESSDYEENLSRHEQLNVLW